jgi:hypothetical protein
MTTFMIAVVAMMVGAAVGFLTARLICGTASSVQHSPYMSWRGDMYRQRAARAAQEKDASIKIAFEHEAAFWPGLAEQVDWYGRKEVSPQITFNGLSLETVNGEHNASIRASRARPQTLYRWRKAPPRPQLSFVATHEAGQPDRTRGGGDRIAELQLENSRLRRLVTDLLLEKIKLEEVAQREKSPREETR